MANVGNTRLGAAERRAQLLETARSVFGENGFSATSMNDIAKEAGVTKPVLYQHFASKHDLFNELLAETAEQLETHLRDEISAGATGREKVERGVRAYVSFFDQSPYRFRVLYGEGVRTDPDFSQRLNRVEDSFHEFAAAQIDIEEIDQQHRLLIARSISGMLESGVGYWIQTGMALSASEVAATLTALLWGGLRIKPANN